MFMKIGQTWKRKAGISILSSKFYLVLPYVYYIMDKEYTNMYKFGGGSKFILSKMFLRGVYYVPRTAEDTTRYKTSENHIPCIVHSGNT